MDQLLLVLELYMDQGKMVFFFIGAFLFKTK